MDASLLLLDEAGLLELLQHLPRDAAGALVLVLGLVAGVLLAAVLRPQFRDADGPLPVDRPEDSRGADIPPVLIDRRPFLVHARLDELRPFRGRNELLLLELLRHLGDELPYVDVIDGCHGESW